MTKKLKTMLPLEVKDVSNCFETGCERREATQDDIRRLEHRIQILSDFVSNITIAIDKLKREFTYITNDGYNSNL